MDKQLRNIAFSCSISAFLILAGFYFTKIPLYIQILLLVVGLGLAIYNMVAIFKFFIASNKQQNKQ